MCIAAQWRGYRCESGANLRTFTGRQSGGRGVAASSAGGLIMMKVATNCNAPCA